MAGVLDRRDAPVTVHGHVISSIALVILRIMCNITVIQTGCNRAQNLGNANMTVSRNLPQEPNEVDLAVTRLHEVQRDQVRKITYSRDQKTGEQITEMNLVDGRTITERQSPSGIREQNVTHVPSFSNLEDRDKAVCEEMSLRGNTQEIVARKFDISQSLVSRILGKNKK